MKIHNDKFDAADLYRKEIQLIQKEILVEIDRICRIEKIPYDIVGGTLLGAVRHQGFIPWDPDADVAMFHHAYERFYQACKKHLDSKRFFLQEWRTDNNYYWAYSRILRNDTVFVRKGYEKSLAKNGVFVDIMIGSNVPDNNIVAFFHNICCFCIRKALWAKMPKTQKYLPWYEFLFWGMKFISRGEIINFYNWVVSWTDGKITKRMRNMAGPVSKKSPSKFGYPYIEEIELRKKYETGILPWNYFHIDINFEGVPLMCSRKFHEHLIFIFGDYMKLPPLEDRRSHIPCSYLEIADYILSNHNFKND